MKKTLITILLIASSLICNAQLIKQDRILEYDFKPMIPIEYKVKETKWDKWRPWVQKAAMVTSVVLEAKGDAEYDEGNKKVGKAYQIASLATFASLIPLHEKGDRVLLQGVSYICIRMGLFDPVYNRTRGLPIDHIGTTSYWDDGVRMFSPPKGMQVWGRTIFLTAGLTIDF